MQVWLQQETNNGKSYECNSRSGRPERGASGEDVGVEFYGGEQGMGGGGEERTWNGHMDEVELRT